MYLFLISAFVLQFPRSLVSDTNVNASYSCSTEFDCSLGGECVDSKCVCNPEWTGLDCGMLNLLPASNYKAFYRSNESSWGGSVIYSSSDNKYHMFVADMSYNCNLTQWETNSRVVHATSDTPDGNYKQVSITVPIWAHNPTAHQIPNQSTDTFVVYHIGNGQDHGTPLNCSAGDSSMRSSENMNDTNSSGDYNYKDQTSSDFKDYDAPNMAVSVGDINGDFTEYDSSDGSWAYNNPGAYFFANGSCILVYKVGCENWDSSDFCAEFAIAISDSYKGPFKTVRNYIGVYGEDPYLWRDKNNNFHILFQGGNYGHGLPGYVGHFHTAYSQNGFDWNVANLTTAYNQTINLKNGSEVQVYRRERSQLLFNDDGQPSYLFNGVTLSSQSSFSFTSVQPINTN